MDGTKALQLGELQMSAMKEIVDTVADHTLDREPFRDVYDALITRLNLANATLTFPPHIIWGRYKHNISGTEDPDRWLAKCSSEGLSSKGLADLAVVQQRLLAGRIVRLLKGSSNDAERLMAEFFCTDRELGFESVVNDTFTALAVVMHRDSYGSLDERVELLEEWALSKWRGR